MPPKMTAEHAKAFDHLIAWLVFSINMRIAPAPLLPARPEPRIIEL